MEVLEMPAVAGNYEERSVAAMVAYGGLGVGRRGL